MNETEAHIRQLAEQPPPQPAPTSYSARPDHVITLIVHPPSCVGAQCSCGDWWRASVGEVAAFDVVASWAASHSAPGPAAPEAPASAESSTNRGAGSWS